MSSGSEYVMIGGQTRQLDIVGTTVYVKNNIQTALEIEEVNEAFAAFGRVEGNGAYHLVRLDNTHTDFIDYMRKETKRSYPKNKTIVLDHADYCIMIHKGYPNWHLTYDQNRSQAEKMPSLESKPGKGSSRDRRGPRTQKPIPKRADISSDVIGKRPHQSHHGRHGQYSQYDQPIKERAKPKGKFSSFTRMFGSKGNHGSRYGDSKNHNPPTHRGHGETSEKRKSRFSLDIFSSKKRPRPKRSDYEKTW